MNFYREAATALRQNRQTVAIFFAVGAIWGVADSAMRSFVLGPASDGSDQALGMGIVGWQVFSVAVMAAAGSVLYARLAREIDKPIWRVADDREAFTLFFRLWFLLGLVPLVYVHGAGMLLPEVPDFGSAMLFLSVAFTIAALTNIVGACIMFYGRVGKQEVHEAFATIGHHAGPVAAICVVGILAGTILTTLHETSVAIGMARGASSLQSLQSLLLAGAIAGADAVIGCFIFAYAWLVCIFHRDHYEQPGDDFDF